MITEQGEYQIAPEDYQSDPVEGGSLRSSMAWTLINQTPAHAAHECPRLNPNYVREEKKHFDRGTIAHTLLLGKGAEFEEIDAEDFRSKDARMVRDRAYRMGKTPILSHELKEVREMVDSVRHQLKALVDYGSLETEPFQHNETERVIVSRADNGVMCRVSLDGMDLDNLALSEFKTEGETADPAKWVFKARRFGYPFKMSFYLHVLSRAGISHSPMARFFVVETKPPYLLSMVRLDDELIAFENERVLKAIKIFGDCQRTGRWPGYSLEGYDLGLTEREKMQAQQQEQYTGNGHINSEDLV